MKSKLSNSNKNRLLYLFTIAFWGVFYYFLPFAGDDWAWGSNVGLERMKNAFDGYNGRYLGNLLIITVTRSVIAKLIICALTMFLLIFILSKIFDNISKTKNGATNYIIAFSSVLVLVLPNQIAFGDIQPFQIFGSTVGWLSGFTNYVVPSVLILVYYYFVTNKDVESKWVNVFLLINGVLTCLCVEHYTLFCILFSSAVLIYRFKTHKKLCKKSLFFLLGSIIGALIMFTNSSYTSMQKGDASNKQRAVGFFGSFKQYASYIFGSNVSDTVVIIFGAILTIGILAFFIFFTKKVYKSYMERSIINLLPIICTVVMTLPLLFTNSGKEIYVIAPRCYFLQYFMLVIFFYSKKNDKLLNSKKSKNAITVFFVFLLIVTSVLFAQLDYMGAVRDKAVNEAVENGYSTVEVVKYPKNVEHIQWASNSLKDKTYLNRYKQFKGIDKSTKVILKK